MKTVRSLFSRQFKIPAVDLDLTWQAYEKWEKDKTEMAKLKEIYNKTYLELLPKHLDIEQKFKDLVEQDDASSLVSFLKEFSENKDYSNEKKINLFERAIEKNVSSQETWSAYTAFYLEHMKSILQQERLLQRAVKNCFWDVNIGVQYLRILEKLHHEPTYIERTWCTYSHH